MKKYSKYILVFSLILILSACMPGTGHNSIESPAGFFMGVWQGWIAPFSLIIGFFDPHVTIYEIYNTGWWYDFGFYMAIISGFGGLSLFRRKSKEDR